MQPLAAGMALPVAANMKARTHRPMQLQSLDR